MKKLLVVLVALTFVLSAGVAMAAIVNSAHDLTSTNTVYYSGAIPMTVGGLATNTDPCLHCHTPHASSAAALWNRTAVTTAPVTGTAIDPRGSGTCVGCHDGTVGDTLVNAPGRGVGAAALTYTWTAVNPIWAVANPDLTNDHPVGAGTNTTALWGTAGWVAAAPASLPFYNGSGAAGDMVECASCHDAHSGNGATFNGLLRSGFACSLCHNK